MPSPSSGGEVTVRDFRSEDEPRALELLAAAFGRWPRAEAIGPHEFFAWKHRSSPFGPSTMLVAEIDGAPVGFMAKMPWVFSFDGQLCDTMRTVDLAVDPAARRRGVSIRLMKAGTTRHSHDVVLAWSNPNQRSRGGAVKAGRGEVALGRRFVGLGGARWRTLGRLRPRAGAPQPQRRPPGESAGAVLGDKGLASRVLAGSRPGPGQIATAANPDFLLWRYGWSGRYRGLVAEHHGHSGLAIFRIQQRGRFSVALICELFAEHADPQLTQRLVRDVRRAAHADLVVAALGSNRLAARCGLVPLLSGTTISVHPQREGLMPDPARRASWALSLGDLEMI